MYKRTIWKDHIEGIQEGTDLNAENLNNIEAGTMESNAIAALHASYRRYENDVVKDTEVSTTRKYTISGGKDVTVSVKQRNNTNYRVVAEISKCQNGNVPATNIIISDKQTDSFKASLSNAESGAIDVVFHVSGGMI